MEQLDLFSGVEEKTKTKLHAYLDELVVKYKIPDFIKNDPIRFPHRYTDPKDQEIMAFVAAMMAQGRRTTIVANLEKLEVLMEKSPYRFISELDYEKQLERFKDAGIYFNSQMNHKQIRKICLINDEAKELLKMAIQELGISARAYDKILKVARTIADLTESEIILPEHISEAIQYRTLDRNLWL